jgi:hypothetical protein
MVIEYQIKRIDPVKAFFYNLQHSRRTKFIILGGASLFFAYSLYFRYRIEGGLVLYDFFLAFLFAIGLVLAIPVLFYLTANTQKRRLTINPEGIETKIGSREDKVLWKVVGRIASIQDGILITGKNANSFSIPASAFESLEQRQSFLDLATQYHSDANRDELEQL